MRFLTLIALVIGSQVGSGALSSPAIFARFGFLGMYAWLIAGFGAMCLAYVFARLCILTNKTGGPHVYTQEVFGRAIGYFTGWVYWMISWISTIVVLIAAVNYLANALSITSKCMITALGLMIWTTVNYINIRGVEESGLIGVLLTIIKVMFFVVLTILAIWSFNAANIVHYTFDHTFTSAISAALWGFIGVETAMTMTTDVVSSKQDVSRAILIGTAIVMCIYVISNLAAIGCVPHQVLAVSLSPYNLIANSIFPGSNVIIGLFAFILCLGSLNAWVLVSGQAAVGLAKDGFLPRVFEMRVIGIVTSGVGVGLIWLFGMYYDVLSSIEIVIDCLTPAFVIIYLICSIALYRLTISSFDRTASLLACVFCVGLLLQGSWFSWQVIGILIVSGMCYLPYVL